MALPRPAPDPRGCTLHPFFVQEVVREADLFEKIARYAILRDRQAVRARKVRLRNRCAVRDGSLSAKSRPSGTRACWPTLARYQISVGPPWTASTARRHPRDGGVCGVVRRSPSRRSASGPPMPARGASNAGSRTQPLTGMVRPPSTATVHIRAAINAHPTTTRTLSWRSTKPYGGDASSAASSTSTTGQPDHNRNGRSRPRTAFWHGTPYATRPPWRRLRERQADGVTGWRRTGHASRSRSGPADSWPRSSTSSPTTGCPRRGGSSHDVAYAGVRPPACDQPRTHSRKVPAPRPLCHRLGPEIEVLTTLFKVATIWRERSHVHPVRRSRGGPPSTQHSPLASTATESQQHIP